MLDEPPNALLFDVGRQCIVRIYGTPEYNLRSLCRRECVLFFVRFHGIVFAGTIPEALGDLRELRELYLYTNMLSGEALFFEADYLEETVFHWLLAAYTPARGRSAQSIETELILRLLLYRASSRRAPSLPSSDRIGPVNGYNQTLFIKRGIEQRIFSPASRPRSRLRTGQKHI